MEKCGEKLAEKSCGEKLMENCGKKIVENCGATINISMRESIATILKSKKQGNKDTCGHSGAPACYNSCMNCMLVVCFSVC